MIKTKKNYYTGLFIVIMAVCITIIPFFIKGMPECYDIRFHISRFISLCKELENKNFFPYYFSTSFGGRGYLSASFYGYLFLYPFALLNQIGLSYFNCFVGIIVFYSLAFGCVTFKVFEYIFKKEGYIDSIKLSTILSVFAVCDIYHIEALYSRCALGEYIAAVFIPIVILGVYKIFKENKGILILACGMTGLVYSHLLSVVITSVTLLFYYSYKIKTIIKNKKIILNTFISAILTLLMSSAFIIPMLYEKNSMDYFIESKESLESLNLCYVLGMNKIPVILSIILTLTWFIWFFIKRDINSKALQMIILPLLFLTDFFPWKLLRNTPAAVIQFPWRFLIFMPVYYFIAIKFFKSKNKKFIKKVLICLMYVIYLLSFYLISHDGTNKIEHRITKNNIETYQNIGFFDYLPKEMAIAFISEDNIYSQAGIDFEKFYKIQDKENITYKTIDSTSYEINVNQNYNANYIIFKKVYYKHLTVLVNNKPVKFYNKNGWIAIDTIIGENNIKIYYKNSYIQYFSLMISMISYCGIIAYKILENLTKRRKKNSFN